MARTRSWGAVAIGFLGAAFAALVVSSCGDSFEPPCRVTGREVLLTASEAAGRLDAVALQKARTERSRRLARRISTTSAVTVVTRNDDRVGVLHSCNGGLLFSLVGADGKKVAGDLRVFFELVRGEPRSERVVPATSVLPRLTA